MNDTSWAIRHRRLILCVGLGIIAAWYGILLGSYLLVPALKDAIRTNAVNMLRSEFASDVQFQSFDVSLWPRVHVSARGVLIGNNISSPLLQASAAEAQSSVLPWHIQTLILEGLSLHIPATGAALTWPRSATTVRVDEIVSEHAYVEILPSAARQTPLHFELAHLRVKNFDPNGAAGFSALITTPEPRAGINASGRVGPWNSADPSLTPLQGVYFMPRCDLSTLPGLQGTLSSRGQFRGVLQRIEIAGDADASEFRLSLGAPRQPLRASFQAAIDAWDASATIEQIEGSLQGSSSAPGGLIGDVKDDRRRDMELNLSANRRRVEDILALALKSKSLPIRAALRTP
jgi:hypothetical protein